MVPRQFSLDYYAVLQVSKTADKRTITSNYRRLARIKHPDRNGNANATAEFQTLQEAYEILSDPGERRRFDTQLDRIQRATSTNNPFASSAGTRSTTTTSSNLYEESASRVYEQAIRVLEQKLQSLTDEKRIQERERFAKKREINRHEKAIANNQEQEEQAAKEDAAKNTFFSFLTGNKFSSSEKEERNRAASGRKTGRIVLETTLRRLEAEQVSIAKRLYNLDAEIQQAGIEKQRLTVLRDTAQAATRRKMAEQQKQKAEEEIRKRKEEQEKREKEEQLRKEREERLRKETEERLRKEREEQCRKSVGEKQRQDQRAEKRRRQEVKEKKGSKYKAGTANNNEMRTPSSTKDSRSCKHQRFWIRVEGRVQCDMCRVTQPRFGFRCPGCQMTACARCRVILKKGPS